MFDANLTDLGTEVKKIVFRQKYPSLVQRTSTKVFHLMMPSRGSSLISSPQLSQRQLIPASVKTATPTNMALIWALQRYRSRHRIDLQEN